MKKYIIFSLLFGFMINLQASNIEKFCDFCDIDRQEFDAIAASHFSATHYRSTAQAIKQDLPSKYQEIENGVIENFIKWIHDDSEFFMREVYKSIQDRKMFNQETRKKIQIPNVSQNPPLSSDTDDQCSYHATENFPPSTEDCASQSEQQPSLFSRTCSAAQSTCSAIYQNTRPLAVASAATAAPYLVQKSGVALPSQATMMLLPAAIVSGKLLTKGQFPLIDTTTIVFDRNNADKKHANIADHIVATSIIHADTICATGAAVTGVAACNQNNSWQATAGFAAASGLLTFSWYKISQFKRAWNASWQQTLPTLELKKPEKATDQQWNDWNAQVRSEGQGHGWDENTPVENIKLRAAAAEKEYLESIEILRQEASTYIRDIEEKKQNGQNPDQIVIAKLNNVGNKIYFKTNYLTQAQQAEQYADKHITYNKKINKLHNDMYVDESISVARQLLSWKTPSSEN